MPLMGEKEWELIQEMQARFEGTVAEFVQAVQRFEDNVENFGVYAEKVSKAEYSRRNYS